MKRYTATLHLDPLFQVPGAGTPGAAGGGGGGGLGGTDRLNAPVMGSCDFMDSSKVLACR